MLVYRLLQSLVRSFISPCGKHVGVRQLDLHLSCRISPRHANQACRGTDCRTAIGHILQYDRHGAYTTVISYRDSAKYLRVSADVHVITQYRHRTVDMAIPNRYTLAQGTIGADFYLGMNENIAKMPNTQTCADGGGFWKTYSGFGFDDAKCQPIQHCSPPFSKAISTLVEAAPQTI
jgi:hypothetical protein